MTGNHQHAPQKTHCEHCGEPVAVGMNGDARFCCNGCRNAYELIRSWGLSDYYDLADAESIGPVLRSSSSFDDLDNIELLGESTPQPVSVGHATGSVNTHRNSVEGTATADSPALVQCTLAIQGLHCAACVWLLEKLPERFAGWQSSTVHYHQQQIKVIFDQNATRLSDIAKLLDSLGYQISPLIATDHTQREEERGLLVQIAIAGFCMANAMWLAIALYAGEFSGIASEHEQLLRIGGAALGVIAVLLPGRVFFQTAWHSLRSGVAHMDIPVSLGLLAGLVGSGIGVFDQEHDVYFDSVASLVFFLLVGRWLQASQQRRAGDLVREFTRIAPSVATQLLPNGQQQRVPVGKLKVGDRVQVNPGESIPVDGILIEGRTTIDKSLLTGESQPVLALSGHSLEAGCGNLSRTIIMQVSAIASESRIAKLQATIADAMASRTKIVHLANRVGGWFVIGLLLLAGLNALFLAGKNSSAIIPRTIALLIVACPCALALATPLAVAVCVGRLARQKILVRDGGCLERSNRLGTIFFDKTGTLTVGKPRVVSFEGDPKFLAIAAALEADVDHPIARSIHQYGSLKSPPFELPPETQIEQVTGQGLYAVVPGIGVVTIGTERFTKPSGEFDKPLLLICDSEKTARAKLPESSSPGTQIFMCLNDELCGRWIIADELKPESAEVVQQLQHSGWQVKILSGDRQDVVDLVAKRLGLARENGLGACSPEEKLLQIKNEAAKSKTVVMVGDGINDSAALAAADIGIAIRGGAASSLEAAPIVLARQDLFSLVTFFDAGKKLRRVVYSNFAISIGYNLAAVTLALAGLITPLIAAVLMPISSLSVLLNTLRFGQLSANTSSPLETSDLDDETNAGQLTREVGEANSPQDHAPDKMSERALSLGPYETTDSLETTA